MAYDLTKLVKVSALQQLAIKIRDLYYNRTEIDTKLNDCVKTVTVGQETLSPTDNNIKLPDIAVTWTVL